MDDGVSKYALEIRLVEVGAVSTILEPDVLASLRAAPNEFMRAGAAFSLTDAAATRDTVAGIKASWPKTRSSSRFPFEATLWGVQAWVG